MDTVPGFIVIDDINIHFYLYLKYVGIYVGFIFCYNPVWLKYSNERLSLLYATIEDQTTKYF